MFSENESDSDRIDHRLVISLIVLFIAIIFVTLCILGAMMLNQRKELRPTASQVIPAELPSIAAPIRNFPVYLPITLSGSDSESELTYKVTKIDNQGYEFDGQRYDLATFSRIDGQVTVQGYCINQGWDVPVIGTEYMLTAGDIFVPLQEPEGDPFQRFLKIQ